MRVKFKSELVECKPGTILTSEMFVPDTLENDAAIIRRFTKIEEINQQSDILLEHLKELKQKKLNGYDVSHEFENLKLKLELVKERREKILDRKKGQTTKKIFSSGFLVIKKF